VVAQHRGLFLAWFWAVVVTTVLVGERAVALYVSWLLVGWWWQYVPPGQRPWVLRCSQCGDTVCVCVS
jgi:hypothetical protein